MLIFNVYGQYTFGTKKVELQYNALKKAFQNISLEYPNILMGFPYKIGCDRAGGDWKIVSKMIEDYFPNHTIVKLPSIKD